MAIDLAGKRHVLDISVGQDADYDRVPITPQRRQGLRVDLANAAGQIDVGRPIDGRADHVCHGLSRPFGPGAFVRVHVHHAAGVVGQCRQQVQIPPRPDGKTGHRGAFINQLLDRFSELAGLHQVRLAHPVADVNHAAGTSCGAGKAARGTLQRVPHIGRSQGDAGFELGQPRLHFRAVRGHKPLGHRHRVQVDCHQLDPIRLAELPDQGSEGCQRVVAIRSCLAGRRIEQHDNVVVERRLRLGQRGETERKVRISGGAVVSR